jgi:hypothetical protein
MADRNTPSRNTLLIGRVILQLAQQDRVSLAVPIG